MTHIARVSILMILISFMMYGCGIKRANVTALSNEQQTYYSTVIDRMESGREDFERALKDQIKINEERRLNLVDWDIDLAEAELLLQVNTSNQGSRTLLLKKMSEIDIDYRKHYQNHNQIDRARVNKLIELYDEIIKSTIKLRENNELLVNYLGSGDAKFTLQSLDVDGITRVASSIREIKNQLDGIEQMSKEEKEKENERVRKAIERTRDVLIKALE